MCRDGKGHGTSYVGTGFTRGPPATRIRRRGAEWSDQTAGCRTARRNSCAGTGEELVRAYINGEGDYSAADVWSCTIFQPSENLLKISVNSPCGILPSGMVKCHVPRTKAASDPRGSIRRSENSSFPISRPSLW